MKKQFDEREQELRRILSENIKKYRARRAWSQFNLAAKSDLSTNFLADIEAGNTWVSGLTLSKLAKALEVEAYELLKPDKGNSTLENHTDTQAFMDKFTKDLSVALQDSVEKTVKHVKKHYETSPNEIEK
ncbi:helix-turn-helix domain-containing protein [Treponema primitia]|uniref:helix-turn-helix domain-containing protein n=1 Tax=Treponema primitia TaxID=88058 RepID=UPI00397E98BD